MYILSSPHFCVVLWIKSSWFNSNLAGFLLSRVGPHTSGLLHNGKDCYFAMVSQKSLGQFNFIQGQGNVREFCINIMSGNF